MTKKLSKRDLFEDSVDEIVGVCTEVSANVPTFISYTNVRFIFDLWCLKPVRETQKWCLLKKNLSL